MPASSQVLDPIRESSDDERAVADAGLMLTGTLVGRLGLERLTDARVSRGYRPGRKFLTVVSTLLAGGDCIEDANLLHAGSTATIVGHDTVAASTVGSWLRSLTFGHIRQLDAVTETALTRAWEAGAGPGDQPLFIDIDSTICEVRGKHKQGAAYGYTRQLGLTSAARGPGRHRRDPPRQDAQRVGRVGPRGATVRARDHRQGPTCWRDRAAGLADGCRVLVPEGHRRLRGPRHAVLASP